MDNAEEGGTNGITFGGGMLKFGIVICP